MRIATAMSACVLAAASPIALGNVLVNGGFEDGTLSSWSSYAAGPPLAAAVRAGAGHSGGFYVTGDTVPPGGVESVVQYFSPIDTAGIAELFFWYKAASTGPDSTMDNMYMFYRQLNAAGSGPGFTPLSIIKDNQWHQVIYGSPGTGSSLTAFGVLVTNTGTVANSGIAFDDFYVGTTPSPSPSAAAALGLGMAALGGRRRKRR